MELKMVPFHQIEEACDRARSVFKETDEYNTHCHSRDEIAAFVPETGFVHKSPSLYTGLYQHWVPLIMDFNNVADWHVFELSRILARDIVDSFSVWYARGEVNKTTLEELISQFPKRTMSGLPTESVLNGANEWFLRLDFCSAKDGERGNASIKTIEDILRSLCTSGRGRTALLDDLASDPKSKPKLFLVPFNKMMNPHREFRVFCPPLTNTISCISQYRWISPFGFIGPEDPETISSLAFQGAMKIHSRILKHAKTLESPAVTASMHQEGFTFDIVMTPSCKVLLVEINPFGAMSGCGSCLYHWIRDAKSLYGLDEKIEVRMTV